MTRTERYWRTVAIAGMLAVAFLLGRSSNPPAAEARSQLTSASEITTNEAGDVLFIYDFNGTNRRWNLARVDFNEGTIELKTLDHPRDSSF